MDLSVKIRDKIMQNPVGTASGTFGFGEEYGELIDLSQLGSIYTKAVTVLPREGNPLPRLTETPYGMINSIGLANTGVKGFLENKVPFLNTIKNCAVIVNVAGSTEDEYTKVIDMIDSVDSVWGYEINISCPNVKCGGLAFGTDPVQVERLTKEIRKRTNKPVIMKLTPNVTDITTVATACEIGGADAVSCINTVMGMKIDINKKKPAIYQKTGGLSGPAIKPVGVAAVYRVSKKISIPVIGLGGIMNWEDAVEYFLAGASAIQIGTANFIDPNTPIDVLDGIKRYMTNNKLEKISDFHSFIE
ncbi:MAG: dihydroorotate dehydrogenase [Spirochaetales bacterium]|nr:dihydroorotate dehydrogenase [Spirochaetales bacterium]